MKRKKISTLMLIILTFFSILPQNYLGSYGENNQNISDYELNDNNVSVEFNSNFNIRLTEFDLHEELWVNEPQFYDIVVNPQGEIYISGTFDNDVFWAGNAQGVVSKLSKDGIVEWTQIINGTDAVGFFHNIKFDSSGNIITSGQAAATDLSSSAGFQDFHNGGWDTYIRKYTPLGEILWDSYFGGFGFDCCSWVEVDSQDNYYFSGSTASFNFPVINSIINDRPSGGLDGFITKMDNDGNLIWSSLIGGRSFDLLGATELISDDVMAFLMWTSSDDLPTLHAVQNALGGGSDTYIGTLNTTSGEIIWGTYYGSTLIDDGYDIEVDPSGNIYIVGQTFSENFTTLNPFDSTFNGTTDGFILKFDPAGNLLWSSLIGGEGNEIVMNVKIDDEGNPLVIGTTSSSDFPTTDGSSYHGGEDIFVTRIKADGSSIISSIIMGGEDDEGISESLAFAYKSDSELLITSQSFSNDFYYGQNKSLESIYEHTFGGVSYGLIINYNLDTETVNWATTLPAISEPYLDYDQDGLTNQEEYDLCFETTPKCTDPVNPDTDGDGIFDGYEVKNSMDPLSIIGFDSDVDEDGLTALEEFQLNTNPNSNDTDGDGMLDLWEVSMGLNPALDDSLDDYDNDLMLNLYEFEHGFNATDFSDGLGDADGDGATNSEEFLAKTDPGKKDTDGDGLPDGWELDHGLDPLNTDDWSRDPDGDFLPNSLEFRLGTNPKSITELYIIIGAVTVFTAVFLFFRRKLKKRNTEAVKEGWENHKQKKQALKAGFNNVEEYKDGVSKGFVNKRVMDLVVTKGFKSTDEMASAWDTCTAQLTLFIGDKQEEEYIIMITEAVSPKQLLIVENNAKQFVQSSESYQEDLNSIVTLQNKIKDLFRQEKGGLFAEITENEITEFSKRLFSLSKGLETKMNKLEQAFAIKKEWFAPWQPLLTLIQITGDGTPISLEKIVEVTNTSQDQAEELLLVLLSENPEIGSYNNQEKMYTKGTDVSKYLEDAMKMSKMLDEEST